MNRTLIKLLVNRAKLAQGSLALVEKQLTEILGALDNSMEILYAEAIRGEEENSDQDFFISPPLSVYDEEVDDASEGSTTTTGTEGRSH